MSHTDKLNYQAQQIKEELENVVYEELEVLLMRAKEHLEDTCRVEIDDAMIFTAIELEITERINKELKAA